MSDNKPNLNLELDPKINIISKEELDIRVQKVFNTLWEVLSKSFGPYGAPTIISQYPYKDVTKDGYRIMRNIAFDPTVSVIDQAIAEMAQTICSRLNYTVGDGTTSAIIATNSIYQSYMKNIDEFKKRMIMPRDILKKFESICKEVTDKLLDKAVEIDKENRDNLYNSIRDVVSISSNGDELITEYISSLYKELGAPSISCIKSPDGVTRKSLINGYKFKASLTDKLYINNDNKTMDLEEADVIMFTNKITGQTYEKIIKPLNAYCKVRKRHLIVLAPTYDEVTLDTMIGPDLNTEYKQNHDINLVLMTYSTISQHFKKLANDFSILVNTTLIDRTKERYLLDQISLGVDLMSLFNIDDRHINGTNYVAYHKDSATGEYDTAILLTEGVDAIPDEYYPASKLWTPSENRIDLGYTKKCSLGMNVSYFTELVYDEEKYKVILNDAKDELQTRLDKYIALGVFSPDVTQCQERLYSLGLKMGIIEVGGESDMSETMLKDTVDDAIKAAESAYRNGIIKGCNLDLMSSIKEVRNKYDDTKESDRLDILLLDILLDGFKNVYRTVLNNAYDGYEIEFTNKEDLVNKLTNKFNISKELEECDDYINSIISSGTCKISLPELLINMSIEVDKVFDVSKGEFNNSVINSVQTDKQILIATIDLISLLITGNQMLYRSYKY